MRQTFRVRSGVSYRWVALLLFVAGVGAIGFACKDVAEPDPGEVTFTDWSAPVSLASLNSAAEDQAPAISPDGLALYFSSTRAGGVGAGDIWVTRRGSRNAVWGAPQSLGASINTTANETDPQFSPDGLQLFLASDRSGGGGLSDVWVATRTNVNDDLSWGTPVNLGAAINSTSDDAFPEVVTLGGQRTLFYSRGLVPADHDLLMSVENVGVFGAPTQVTELNTTTAAEACPAMRADGREVFFCSDRAGGAGLNDIWTSVRATATAAWSTPTGATALNTPSDDRDPALDLDSLTIFFASSRPGGSGGSDLYMATRTPR